MTQLSMDQIAQAAHQAGFNGQALQYITAIAMRESSGQSDAYNPNVHTGDQSWGLWQINTLGNNGPNIRRILQGLGYSGDFHDLWNPVTNAQVAYKLSGGGTNFEPWRSHSPGWEGPQGFLTNATQYLDQAASSAAKVQMGKAANATLLSQKISAAQQGQGGPYGQMIGWLNQQLGKPYRFASTGPDAFDCSGLVSAMYKQLGIDIPALTFTMKDYGAPVPLNQMQPGDMIFKHGAQGDFGHVGVYVGGGKVIDAPHTGAFVETTDVSNWQNAQGVRRLVDSQGRLITGAGLVPGHTANIGTVPLGQATSATATSMLNPSGAFTDITLTGASGGSDQPPPFTLPSHDFTNILTGLGSKVASLA